MKRLIRMLITTAFTLAVFITASYAWFTHTEFVEPNVSGYSVAAYFGGGDGSAEKPFEIKNQRHLYNLAWLQYLGYFNKRGSGNVPDTSKNTLTQYSFIINVENAKNELDMDGWCLPPIGTSLNPFIGSLDGNGKTISNLTTTNDFGSFGSRHPSSVDSSNFGNKDTEKFSDSNSCSVIGFIGSIGLTSKMEFNNLENPITPAANVLKNITLNKNVVTTGTEETLIGSVAGYVNGKIEDVGVRLPKLNINTNAAVEALLSKTTNLSDYAVVGYAEEQYTTALTKNATTIYNPTTEYSHFSFNGMGDTNDWGGSIDMKSLYTRINSQIGGTQLTSYVTQEIQYNYEHSVVQVNGSPSSTHYYKEFNDGSGAYLTQNTAPYNGYDYLTALYKTVVKVTKSDNVTNGYIISNSSNSIYLDITSTRASNNSINFNVSINNNSDNQRVWILDNNKLYTYSEDDGRKYYLNATTSALSISTSGTTNWYMEADNALYFSSGSYKYYLKRYNGTWNTTPLYVISDNNGNYLKLSNNTTVTNTTALSDATIWYFSNTTNPNQPYGTARQITADGDRTNYYLTLNGHFLSGTTSGTTWSYNDGVYNGSNYIQYKNGYWVANTKSSYSISNSNNYLSTTLSNTTQSNAALWTFNNNVNTNGNTGSISICLNNQEQYLSILNGQLALSNNSVNWTNENNRLYLISNNQYYYLVYDDTWKLDTAEYYIKDSNNNYLSFKDEDEVQSTNISTTLWHFSNGTATYPNGYISYNDGNTTYYLDHDGTNVILSNLQNTSWNNDGDGLYCYINGQKNYLYYDSTWKLIQHTCKIKNGTNYLSIDSNGNIINTNEESATEWTFSTYGNNPSGTISYNGRYISVNNGLLTSTTNVNNALSINNVGSGLYDNNNNYIQYYNGKWTLGIAYKIYYDDNYLNTTDGNTISNSTNSDNSAIWFLYNTNNSTTQGYIYTINNNSIKYLNTGNNESLVLNTTPTQWILDEYGITQDESSYIQYFNNWILSSGFFIYQNGYYLNTSNGTNISAGTTPTTMWYLNANNNIYNIFNGNNYYLLTTRNNSPSLSCANSGNYRLIYNNNRIYYSYNNRYYYLINESGSWNTKRSSQYASVNSFDPIETYWNSASYNLQNSYIGSVDTNMYSYSNIIYEKELYNELSINLINKKSDGINKSIINLTPTTTNVYTREELAEKQPSKFNYIPLNTDNKNVVKGNNTGYIMSGGHSGTSGGLAAVDIRVAANTSSYTISSRLNQSVNTSSGSIETIYTYKSNGLNVINDYSAYVKLNASKKSLEDTFKKNAQNDSGRIGGIHFITSQISMNNLITADTVLINNKTSHNYQMPENSIDFKLASKGYINFFAGLYYPGNTSFFSLYDICRDEEERIIKINHIKKIYQYKYDKSLEFVYEYEEPNQDGYTFSNKQNSISTSDYDLLFDTTWIETPTLEEWDAYSTGNKAYYMTKLYYFEIPVNKGEYALGSVNNHDGGYLLYLDIGANAAPVDRTTITQESKTEISDYKYVNGIQILADGQVYGKDSNSAVATIAVIDAGTVGQVSISRTITDDLDTIAFANANNFVSKYANDGITLSSNVTRAGPSDTKYKKILRYIDYNRQTEKLYYSTIINDGNNNISYTVYDINSNKLLADQNTLLEVIKENDYGLLSITNKSGVPSGTRVDDYTKIDVITSEKEPPVLNYDLYVSTAKKDTITNNVDITVDRAYSAVSNADTSINVDGLAGNAKSSYAITNTGSLTLTGETAALGYTQDSFTLEHVYKLTGDIITITSGETTTVTVKTYDTTYTFVINGTTVDANHKSIEVTAS